MSQHPADLKPRGVKAPMHLIPWEVVPDECMHPIMLHSMFDKVDGDPDIVMEGLARACISEVGLEAVARVFEHGANKYARDNWKSFTWDQKAEDEYFGAICRHLTAAHTGEVNDPESGLPHVAHAAAGALITLWHQKQ